MRGITTGQFGSFDGADNRRELMILMQRLGQHLPSPLDRERRARFLQHLLPRSTNCLATKPLVVDAKQCDPVGAYWLLVSITGALGVPIDVAARMLDEAVRSQQ